MNCDKFFLMNGAAGSILAISALISLPIGKKNLLGVIFSIFWEKINLTVESNHSDTYFLSKNRAFFTFFEEPIERCVAVKWKKKKRIKDQVCRHQLVLVIHRQY